MLYAESFQNAINFLTSSDKVNPNQQQFIAEHLKGLEASYRFIYPNGDIEAPHPNLKTSEPSINLTEKTTKVLDRSPQLGALKGYYEYLLKDCRSHTFFFCIDFREKRKAGVLRQFIQDFENSGNKVQFLANFYGEKGVKNSRYEILNTGQNITSWLFGLKTTTIDKIDELVLSLGLNPQKAENLNRNNLKI